jgi:hypothetical protein
MRDKLMPSVNYLQRLGPEYLDLIFEHSRWVFEKDDNIAFEVRYITLVVYLALKHFLSRYLSRMRLSCLVRQLLTFWRNLTL